MDRHALGPGVLRALELNPGGSSLHRCWVTTACEYLADEGIIGKASTPVRLTRKSNIEMQELAFFSL